jgi:hypothetical protein
VSSSTKRTAGRVVLGMIASCSRALVPWGLPPADGRFAAGTGHPVPGTSGRRAADLGLGAENDVLSEDEQVERIDDRAGFGLSGAAESGQTGGVLVVGDQLKRRVRFPAHGGHHLTK